MIAQRLLLGLAALMTCAASLAATVGERSPFSQGHWWDPSRAGTGFEIFNVGDQAMVIWYTYEASGRPVWYTAQGNLADLGTRSWALMRHGWANGRKAAATEVGTLRVTLQHTDRAEIAWSIGATSGTWSIVPFVVSGVMNEVDHTGSWFDPANSGWGITVTEQGDVLGGVLYIYDTSGAPTWAAGFGRERGSVDLFSFDGACPSCAYRNATSRSVGRLGFDFRAESDAVLANNLTLPMADGIALDAARVVQLSRPASRRPADRQLANFATRAELKAFLDVGMLNLRPAPAGTDFSPAPAATTFSPTNLVESGVDEAGLVKTDGSHIYTFAHEGNARQSSIRIARVAEEGASLEMRGTFALNGGVALPLSQAGLYLHEGQLVAVTGTQASAYGSPWLYSGAWMNGRTQVEIISLGPDFPARMRWRAEIDGHVIASRRVGERLYVVTRFAPALTGLAYGSSPAALASNQALLASTPLAALLPKVRVNGGGDAAELVAPASVFVPPLGSRAPTADMIVVTEIDLAQARVAQSLAIAGEVETVYASPSNLYLATSRSSYRSPSGVALAIEPNSYTTEIHQVRFSPGALAVAGSASVEGLLGFDIDQAAFRMSEHQDRLRVVSSSNTWWGAGVKNRLTVLERSAINPGLLRTVSYLPNAQRPESLGKPGELLYGTRFVGERLYAVTFRQVDPLYVVDLANAADPRITGALEVPGFSEYLHPLPNGLLLGFGKDATPDGLFQGLQLSLFDVSDAGRPRQVQKVVIGKRGSESALLRHHHAFSALPQADGSTAIAIPARIHDGAAQHNGSFAYYPWQHSGLVRFEIRGGDAASARLVQLAPLVSHQASAYGQSFYQDPAIDGGRSILFRGGTVYIGNGQFWRQDSAGNTAGPY